MKKLFACFLLFATCASVCAADEAVTISRAFPTQKPAETEPAPAVVTRAAAVRTTIPRIAPAAAPAPVESMPTDDDDAEPAAAPVSIAPIAAPATPPARTATISRAVNFNQPASADSARAAGQSRGGVSRAGANSAAASDSRSALDAAVHTVGRDARVEAAGINSTAAARRAGVTLRSSVAEVGGRATIGDSGMQTGSNIGGDSRTVRGRAAAVTKESIAEATERLQQTSDLNKSCQQQYNDCMDQFCSVVDANQKRCSCSANLSKYSKVEQAVKDANVQLNDVAQRIRYIGLSADEIRAIMSATEAELEMSGKRDTTESRGMLEEIEKMIKNPTGSASYSGDNFSGLDMDLDFSAGMNDLFSLDFLNTSSSFSNLRGSELYNAAKKRCNTVLTQCKGAGATTQQVTGNYDLAIDKDCLAYEQGLGKMNDTLKNNVRSANLMLQKARLAVLQNKNQYDAKGCIGALNTCMIDDMVCGADYAKCLDPTKRYIDENGTVVLGQRIADITDFMTAYDNSAINSTFLEGAKALQVSVAECKGTSSNNGKCVAKYLLEKIGTGATVSNGGLCRAVLDKCQRVSYDDAGKYNPYNDVVVNYIQRAMVNIAAAQQQIIADYASSCMLDIASCYNQQVSQVNAWSSAAGTDSVYNVMRGACRNVALTCAYAIFASDRPSCPVGTGGKEPGTTTDCSNESCRQDNCINSISEIFYQSLLCPSNSTYQATPQTTPDNNNKDGGYVNVRCKCNSGYRTYSGQCVLSCGAGTSVNGPSCEACAAGTYNDGITPNVLSCADCTAGKYCPRGTSSPKSCPAGSYCPLRSSEPIICPANYYCGSNLSAAAKCPTGTPYSCPGSTISTSCVATTPTC